MNRLRLYDFRLSRAANLVGICQGDIAATADLVNTAQRRLVFAREAGETGWWGSWAKMVFNVSKNNPYLTTPREVARLEQIDVCSHPVPIQNEFYEFLQFGAGLQPQCQRSCAFLQAYDRGIVPTFADLVPPRMGIRIYLTDAADAGKRVLIQGKDVNDSTITSADGLVQVQGVFVVLAAPFVDGGLEISSLTGFQKDITNNPIKIYAVNLDTAVQTLLLTMEGGEQVAGYRRYLLNGLPLNCCNTNPPSSTAQVTAMAKLELIPARVDTDYLLIQNIEALVEECQSVRFGTMDNPAAAQNALLHHRNAIGLLNGELTHYLGKDKPAVIFKPYGNASLRRQDIGSMT